MLALFRSTESATDDKISFCCLKGWSARIGRLPWTKIWVAWRFGICGITPPTMSTNHSLLHWDCLSPEPTKSVRTGTSAQELAGNSSRHFSVGTRPQVNTRALLGASLAVWDFRDETSVSHLSCRDTWYGSPLCSLLLCPPFFFFFYLACFSPLPIHEIRTKDQILLLSIS